MKESKCSGTEAHNACIPVRVWTGYALPELRRGKGRQAFYDTLGSVFIPATVQIMQPLGLSAYLPTVVPPEDDPCIPDEVALVFYPSCRHYEQAKGSSTGGRAYQKLHATVFNFQPLPEAPKSHSSFPQLFSPSKGAETRNGNYTLFQDMVDWQCGCPTVLIATFPPAARNHLTERLHQLQQSPPTGVDGLIFSLNDTFIVVWTHWQKEPATMNPFNDIEGLRPIVNKTYETRQLPMPVTTEFSGVPVTPGVSYNFQFNTISPQ